MKIRFTPKVAYRMVDKAKRIFCNYPHNTVPLAWKVALRYLRVFIVINPKLQTTAGTACFVRVRAARKLFQIPKKYPPIKVDGVKGYLIIEINPKLVVLDDAAEVYDTVSHELAHCLDYVLRGWYDRTEASWHDEFWSFLHKRMGGDGQGFLSRAKNKIELQRAKRKAHTITTTFNPLDKVRKSLTIKV